MRKSVSGAIPASDFLEAFDRLKENKSMDTAIPNAVPAGVQSQPMVHTSGFMTVQPIEVDRLAGLKAKMHSVYSKIDSIVKNGDNTGQHYKYVRAVDVTEEVRQALIDIKVYAEINFDILGQSYTIARSKDKDAPFSAVNVRCTITFHDLESTATLTASALGTGADAGDKAVYKAQTGALKYALKNAFLIPETDKTMEPEGDPATDEEPASFEDVRDRHAAPAAAPKAAPATSAPRSSTTTPTPASIPPAPVAAAPVTTSTPTSTAPSVGGPMPTDDQIAAYRTRFKKVGDDLALAGLKASANPKLPVNVKIRVYMQRLENVNDPKEMSTEKWEHFFTTVAAIPAAELVRDVNLANGIEAK